MGEIIEFASNGSRAQGYLAVPDSGHGPGVIVIQEWWGVNPHIRDVVDRLADEGFVALAPDHYRGAVTTEPDEAGKLMLGLQIATVAKDLAGAASALVSLPSVDGDRIGTVGFCMGGGLALLAPTVSDAIVCTSAFYPATPWPDYDPDWSRYARKAALINKAEADEPRQGPAIASYAEQIAAHGGTVVIEEYAGSQHAFFNDDRPEVYDAAHAERAWGLTLDLFRRSLG